MNNLHRGSPFLFSRAESIRAAHSGAELRAERGGQRKLTDAAVFEPLLEGDGRSNGYEDGQYRDVGGELHAVELIERPE
jgi:hypothetical protein